MTLKRKYTEGRINYFEGRKKNERPFECRRFTVKEANKSDTKIRHINEVNKIGEAERNIVNKGASLFVVKSYEWL
jgi:hypothetical protein